MSETDNQKNNYPVEQDSITVQKPAELTPQEIGGPKGPEPTRYGDWEKNGRCIDF